MKSRNYGFGVTALAGLSFLLANCMTAERATGDGETHAKTEIYDSSLSLADYLQRVSGVAVHDVGGQIRVVIRGNLSFETNSEPLYVINGVRSGYDYNSVARMVPMASVQLIEVLKGNDASAIYGMAGANGAIVIRSL